MRWKKEMDLLIGAKMEEAMLTQTQILKQLLAVRRVKIITTKATQRDKELTSIVFSTFNQEEMEDYSQQCKELLADFDAKDEEELQKKLYDEALILNCLDCGREVNCYNCCSRDGDPYCEDCVTK